MADQGKAAKQGEGKEREKGEGEEGGSMGEEEVKRRRGRPPKTKAGDKKEDKEMGGLRRYLFGSKNAGDDKGIEKGKELERTPVKKITTRGLAAEDDDKEKDNVEKEKEMAAARGEKKMEESGLGGAVDEEEHEKYDGVSVSEDGCERMSGEAVAIRELRDRLERIGEIVLSKAEEVVKIKEEMRYRDIVIEGLQRRVAELIKAAANDRLRIEELERWKTEWGRAGKQEGKEKGGIGIERGDNNNNNSVRDSRKV